MKTVQQLIQTARKHVFDEVRNREYWTPCRSSAELCLTDAIVCYDRGDFEHAIQHAIKSIAHSVGVFHADYKKATKVSKAMGFHG